MPKEKIEGLLTEISESIGEHKCSIQQKQLLEGVERHMHDMNESDKPDPKFIDTLELLLIEFEEEHPKAYTAIQEIINTLAKMGI